MKNLIAFLRDCWRAQLETWQSATLTTPATAQPAGEGKA